MALFLPETDGIVRFLMETVILKKVMDKAYSSISLTKIDLNSFTKQKPFLLGGFEVCCKLRD